MSYFSDPEYPFEDESPNTMGCFCLGFPQCPLATNYEHVSLPSESPEEYALMHIGKNVGTYDETRMGIGDGNGFDITGKEVYLLDLYFYICNNSSQPPSDNELYWELNIGNGEQYSGTLYTADISAQAPSFESLKILDGVDVDPSAPGTPITVQSEIHNTSFYGEEQVLDPLNEMFIDLIWIVWWYELAPAAGWTHNINTVQNANLADVNDVLKANIEKINTVD